MDGKDKSIRNPIAFYHKALMQYRPELDLEIIVFFEKMLVYYRTTRLKTFEYQQDRLAAELHIKRTRLEKARSLLVKSKILMEFNPVKGKKIRYSINKDSINEIIQSLYLLPEEEPAKSDTIKELRTQCPDLFCYSKDKTNWFFCEVKGKGDRLQKEQGKYFESIESLTGKKICSIRVDKMVY
jgi:hypothetical protein